MNATGATGTLLRRCAAPRRDAGALEVIRAAAAAIEDWPSALRVARGHGVEGLVRAALNQAGAELPPAAAAELQTNHAGRTRRALVATAETARLLRFLRDAGVQALPLKGPVLAQMAYGDTALRDYGDLDLLVPAEQLARAGSVVADAGYAPSGGFSARETVWWTRSVGQLPRLVRDGDERLPLELHGAVHPPGFQVPLERAGLLDRATRLRVDGLEVPSLSVEDTLLVSWTHGMRSDWRRLEWVAAPAWLAAGHDVDWDVIERVARRHGLRRMVAVGLRLAEELLGCPAQPRLAGDARAAALADALGGRLLEADPVREPPAGTDWSAKRLEVLARERVRDKARVLTRAVLAPNLADVAAERPSRAPDVLLPVLRVGRLTGQAVAEVRRRRAGKSPVA